MTGITSSECLRVSAVRFLWGYWSGWERIWNLGYDVTDFSPTAAAAAPLVADDDGACCSLFAWGTRSHNFNAMHIRAEGKPPTGRSSCYIQSFIDFCNARYVMDVRGVSCYGKHMRVLLLVSPPLHVRELLHPPPATLPCWNSMPRGFPPSLSMCFFPCVLGMSLPFST